MDGWHSHRAIKVSTVAPRPAGLSFAAEDYGLFVRNTSFPCAVRTLLLWCSTDRVNV
jgi:hypothetical protein